MRLASLVGRPQGPAWASAVAIVSLALISVSLLGTPLPSRDPTYTDYPAEAVFHGPAATPKFHPSVYAWPDGDPKFRRSVEFQLAKGPNFDGAYIVVKTSCGTGCAYIVIVDVRTGRIFEDLPFRMLVVGASNRLRGLSFRLEIEQDPPSRSRNKATYC